MLRTLTSSRLLCNTWTGRKVVHSGFRVNMGSSKNVRFCRMDNVSTSSVSVRILDQKDIEPEAINILGILSSAQFQNEVVGIDSLLRQVKAAGMPIMNRLIHVKIIKGTLPLSEFQELISQTILYLEGCLNALWIAESRFIPHRELFENIISGAEGELVKHRKYEKSFSRNSDINNISKASKEYIEFLMNVARGGELVGMIGALWPCFFLYSQMYCNNIKKTKGLTIEHPYYEYVKHNYERFYNDKEFSPSPTGEIMINTLKILLIHEDCIEQARLINIFLRNFYQSLLHEKRFSDSIYEMNGKAINFNLRTEYE